LLSVVTMGRNDGYNGDFVARLQKLIDSCTRLASLTATELVLVDYNPPKDKPPLAAELNWQNQGRLLVNVITVPYEAHVRLPNPHRYDAFEFIAKNVGIRRAKGTLILATNADVYFSEQMMERLAKMSVYDGFIYRANRHDVRNDKVIAVHHAENDMHTNGCGDFTMMTDISWQKLMGYPEVPWVRHVDAMILLLAKRFGYGLITLGEPVYHQDHPRDHRYGVHEFDKSYQDWEKNGCCQLNKDDWGLGALALLPTWQPGMETFV
jgi:hypothetical protein